jgi:hypothetical protein
VPGGVLGDDPLFEAPVLLESGLALGEALASVARNLLSLCPLCLERLLCLAQPLAPIA